MHPRFIDGSILIYELVNSLFLMAVHSSLVTYETPYITYLLFVLNQYPARIPIRILALITPIPSASFWIHSPIIYPYQLLLLWLLQQFGYYHQLAML
jgi:hypothetical protein